MPQLLERLTAAAIALIAVAAIAATAMSANAAPSSGHWCRHGDPPLQASKRTTCEFAGTITTRYVNSCHQARMCHLRLHDPSSGRRYRITCHRTGTVSSGSVHCHGPAGKDIWTRFTAAV